LKLQETKRHLNATLALKLQRRSRGRKEDAERRRTFTTEARRKREEHGTNEPYKKYKDI
jgi:hypothetical protein